MKPTDTEAPSREIDWTAMFDSSPYLIYMKDIDLEALERFVIAANSAYYDGDLNDIFDPSNITVSIDEEAALNAAGLITIVMGGIEKGCDMKGLLLSVLGKRKITERAFNPHTVQPGSLAWNIVEQYVGGEIRHKKARKQLMKKCHLSKTTAERALRVIRVRIEHPIDSLNSGSRVTFK